MKKKKINNKKRNVKIKIIVVFKFKFLGQNRSSMF